MIKGIFRKFLEPPRLSLNLDSKTYEEYWEGRGAPKEEYAHWSKLHRKVILSEILEDGRTLLDVGCGNCSFFDLLSKKKSSMALFGIEISEAAQKIALEKGYKVTLKDLATSKLEDQYDYITILNVLEHTQYAEEILLNLKEAFKISLYISVPNFGYIGYRVRLGFFGRTPDTGCHFHVREHIRFWTFADFVHWSDFYGLTVSRVWGNVGGLIKSKYPSFFSDNILYELKRK